MSRLIRLIRQRKALHAKDEEITPPNMIRVTETNMIPVLSSINNVLHFIALQERQPLRVTLAYLASQNSNILSKMCSLLTRTITDL
jgi:hypothetical protein